MGHSAEQDMQPVAPLLQCVTDATGLSADSRHHQRSLCMTALLVSGFRPDSAGLQGDARRAGACDGVVQVRTVICAQFWTRCDVLKGMCCSAGITKFLMASLPTSMATMQRCGAFYIAAAALLIMCCSADDPPAFVLQPLNSEFAKAVIDDTHQHYINLREGKTSNEGKLALA